MRIAVCALSAVLLSGCSWLGNMGGGMFGGGAHNASGHYGVKTANRCQIASPQAQIPRGCHPSQVTLAAPGGQFGNASYAGGFSQKPQFGQGGYGGAQTVTGEYGSHAANAGAYNTGPAKRMRKPKWRGSLSLGVEKSNSGDLLDYDIAGVPDPQTEFVSFSQESRDGLPQDGLVTTGVYTAVAEAVSTPSISFDDIYSTPTRIAGGVEYIFSPRTTVFANAGYSYAEGEDGAAAVIGRIDAVSTFQGFQGNAPFGREFIVEETMPNLPLSTYSYDFTDMRRIDLEVGARHYLKPIMRNSLRRSLTPFVGASVGASHYNGVSYDIRNENLRLQTAFLSGGSDLQYDQIQGPRQTVDLYDSKWVPSGQINAGVEWQATPKTAIALETGLRFEGSRDYTNGNGGDNNVAIPFTIRGSYNF